MLGIAEGEAVATELITREQDTKQLSSTEPFRTMVPPYDAVVWKIRHNQIRQKAKK